MATCDLFGVSYTCPDPSPGPDPFAGYDWSAWSSWTVGQPTPSGVIPATSDEGGQAPSVNDVVAVGQGIVGLVMSIVAGVATIKDQDNQTIIEPAAQLPVLSGPVAAAAVGGNGNGAEMDWLPIAIGGGLLLVLLMGMRR